MRIIFCASALAAVLLATGCWDEEDGNSSPIPTPTPSPTATPNPTPTVTPTPTPRTSRSRPDATEGDVTLNNANIIEAAASDAVTELTSIEEILASEPLDPEKLSKARAALANAREAFFVVETSLYYTDPDSEAELVELPPKLATALPDLKLPGFDDLEDALASRNGETSAASDSDLRSIAKSLREDLEVLATAWNPESLGNFRNDTFLPDPNATGRIFQGIVTVSDILVLSSLDPDESQILQRLWAMKYVLEGSYEGVGSSEIRGSGMLDLVSSKNAALAKSIRSDLNSLIKVYENPPISSEAASAIEQLNESIQSVADLLGYEIAPASPQ